MASFVYDTSFVIDYFQGLQDAVDFYDQCKNNKDGIFFSAITVTEVLSADEIRKKAMFETGVIAVDRQVADIAANLRAQERAEGRRLKTPDAIIIATAFLEGHTLVTHDDQMKAICKRNKLPTESIR